MTRSMRFSVLASFVVVLAVGLAGTAGASVIAQWTFDGAGDAFVADSSGHGHTLGNNNVAQSSSVTATGSGSSAYFDASLTAGFWTTNTLDLSAYRHLRISWSQLVQTDATGMLFEHSPNSALSAGGFCADVNEKTPGISNFQLGDGTWADGHYVLNAATSTHAHGSTNTTWENLQLDINLDASPNDSVLTLLCNGHVAGSYENYPWASAGVDNKGPAAGAFGNYYFNIGARQGGSSLFTGYIDNLTVESVPEPSALILVATAVSGLLAYAWRKRR